MGIDASSLTRNFYENCLEVNMVNWMKPGNASTIMDISCWKELLHRHFTVLKDDKLFLNSDLI